MRRGAVTSWNRWPVIHDQTVLRLRDRHEPLPDVPQPFIALGNGRSYSDVCLNQGGFLLDTRRLDKFISFDPATGLLCCEAGVLLGDILHLVVPRGWFLPVTPGTRQVTVGGAIANDVHGKNHHVAGSFGQHVSKLAVRRSDGSLITCGPDCERSWFSATVGGLGLTGVILWAEIQLVPIDNPMMLVQARRFRRLEEFWALNAEASTAWPYTVAWVDCMSATENGQLRGVLFCGRHAPDGSRCPTRRERSWRIGFDPPCSVVNRLSARLFNAAYFLKERDDAVRLRHHVPYFYPLDGIQDWNRLYGPRGFFQFQCVLPTPQAAALAPILQRIARSGEATSLSVLKTFGESEPAGMLSFARPGITLAVDVPNRGEATQRLLRDLDDLVLEANGALYPAKDARMPARLFRAGFPRAAEFARHVDPMASSSFWRRVSA